MATCIGRGAIGDEVVCGEMRASAIAGRSCVFLPDSSRQSLLGHVRFTMPVDDQRLRLYIGELELSRKLIGGATARSVSGGGLW